MRTCIELAVATNTPPRVWIEEDDVRVILTAVAVLEARANA